MFNGYKEYDFYIGSALVNSYAISIMIGSLLITFDKSTKRLSFDWCVD